MPSPRFMASSPLTLVITYTYKQMQKHNLLKPFSAAWMCMLLGLTTWYYRTTQETRPWERLISSLSSYLPVSLHLGVHPHETSPIYTGMAAGIRIALVLFRQPGW